MNENLNPEEFRLHEDKNRERNWKRWGPYLANRQWGTVREDYSKDGDCWNYFTHDMSRSRAYRWGEDGLLGITDAKNRMCFSLALWNGKDAILKERLFGLTAHEGNHGEDVKELYFYLESTPTHSYMKALYKYPIDAFPYRQLIEENKKRGRNDPEFEIIDTGVFNNGRYFDVSIEYAKAKPNDLLIQITVENCSNEEAEITVLPTLLFRNTWTWGQTREDRARPRIFYDRPSRLETKQSTMGRFFMDALPQNGSISVPAIYTENDSNYENRSFSHEEEVAARNADQQLLLNISPNLDVNEDDDEKSKRYYKDAFHEYIINDKKSAVNPNRHGTKAAFIYKIKLAAGQKKVIQLRLYSENDKPSQSFGKNFEEIFEARKKECDEFYDKIIAKGLDQDKTKIIRQAYAGLLWSKQYYYYIVKDWLKGDSKMPRPPEERKNGRNKDWGHLYNKDIISMPDKWEYPWYAAWDLAFHMIPFSTIDQDFAEEQLLLFLKEWFMHPNGQIPAYEFSFSDVNPPVHAWACWRVYKNSGPIGSRKRSFLEESFQKLLINFTWWVNRKDLEGNNLFSGGFLGLDNIAVFDRSNLPAGSVMIQADGTAWMAFYCCTMLRMAMELASEEPIYSGMASKFFEHFLSISAASNKIGDLGLWDDTDGFYYDQLLIKDKYIPLKVRSMVGIIPLFAATIVREEVIMKLPHFEKRMNWLLEDFKDLANDMSFLEAKGEIDNHRYLLALPNKKRLKRVLHYVLDENEFLSPFGIRSLSKYYDKNPFVLIHEGKEYTIKYTPGESDTYLFGGNSNWRGPIWFPLNHLLVESLLRYHEFYGNEIQVECPTGSGHMKNLKDVALEICSRLTKIFVKDTDGHRPVFGKSSLPNLDPKWKDLVLFYEYFHGETGIGLGASHQTGWTALLIKSIEYAVRLDD